MKVIDTFLFVEAYEAELLLLKLHNEAPVVDRWVLVESDVTFRGDHKGLQANALVAADARFAPFRDRITIVEHRGRLYDGPANYDTFYNNEARSRVLAWDAVKDEPDDAWVIISDVDESVDGADTSRRETFLRHLNGNGGRTVAFGHARYWYDFDNRGTWGGTLTPVTQVGTIKKGQASFESRVRRHDRCVDVMAGDAPLFFEYTFCFSRDAMWKKLNSFIHDKYTPADLDAALLTNHWVKAPARHENVGERGKDDWMETVALTPDNSPAYVRDNLDRLKTHAVSPEYKEHRRKIYGC